MKEREIPQIKTISAGSLKEFDKLYNSTARELGTSITDKKDFDETTTRFYYVVTERQAETIGDDFMQHNVVCHCADCPFLEIGTDARRKTFPCRYSPYGESRVDAHACEVFYREAVRRMKEACNEDR